MTNQTLISRTKPAPGPWRSALSHLGTTLGYLVVTVLALFLLGLVSRALWFWLSAGWKTGTALLHKL